MSKIGIITMYYQSQNCGGNLQAYALEKFINKHGFDAEQISYDYQHSDAKKDLGATPNGKTLNVKRLFRVGKKVLLRILKNSYYADIIDARKKSFEIFNKNIIKHSFTIYSDKTIQDANNDYEIFITGSDQVWNLNWYDPNFFLSFVDHSKPKIAYAASIAMEQLNSKQSEIVKRHLCDFQAISVRENNAVRLIKSVYEGGVEHVLDPTLLLDANDWDTLCGERMIEENYLFCYFLGENTKERALAKKFARAKGLKIVVIPFANGCFVPEDLHFGDIIIKDSSPQVFLSLIKYAKCVFTDSFHAVIFSNIYHKEFFVFNRSARGEMSSRIDSITHLLKTSERFCNTAQRENLNYIISQPELDYTIINTDFETKKQKSIAFLLESIRGK